MPKEPQTPTTPRTVGHLPMALTPSFIPPDVKPNPDIAALRAEVDSLQAQLKSVFDMLQDQGHALAMEAQERCQLAKLLQAEREERSRDVQELRDALEAERAARTKERQDFTGSLQAEVESRTSDVRELAKSLQAECNARAGEVAQLAKVFQSEREERLGEAEELAQSLRAEIADARSLAAAGQPGGVGGPAAPGEVGGQAMAAQRHETAELAQRLNELTQFVMLERETHGRALEELKRGQQGACLPPVAAA